MEPEDQEREIEMESEPIVIGGGAVNSVNGKTGDVVLTTSDLENDSDYQTGTEVDSAISTAVDNEATARENADNNLQEQIDDKQDTLTAGENITIENNVISAIGGGGVKTLTADDYNYPVDNPTSVNPGMLEPGIYRALNDDVYVFNGAGINKNRASLFFLVSDKNQNGWKFMWIFDPNGLRSTGGYKITCWQVSPRSGNSYLYDDGRILQQDYVAQSFGQSQSQIMSQKAVTDFINSLVISGSGAPTTSTTGTVGQLYEDTTNGKLYQCTAVSGGTYTWEEVGASGGGGDTVYSDKSTSSSSTGGAVYIGNLDTSQEEQPDPTTYDNHFRYFWALPYTNVQVPQRESINIFGQNSGNYAISLGINAIARLDNQIAIGPNTLNNYSATNGVSIGVSAWTQADNSVALGSNAKATRAGEVNIGTGTSGSGYNSTNYRVIGGLHDGQDAHDAVTVEQLNATIDAINSATGSSIPHVGV